MPHTIEELAKIRNPKATDKELKKIIDSMKPGKKSKESEESD